PTVVVLWLLADDGHRFDLCARGGLRSPSGHQQAPHCQAAGDESLAARRFVCHFVSPVSSLFSHVLSPTIRKERSSSRPPEGAAHHVGVGFTSTRAGHPSSGGNGSARHRVERWPPQRPYLEGPASPLSLCRLPGGTRETA